MSGNIMNYRGYPAKVEYSDEDGCLVGRVLGIRDIIGFHGDSVGEAEKDFHAAIDFYLASCKRRGKEPNRPEYEDIPLAIPAEIYSGISLMAETSGKTVNATVIGILQAALPAKQARAKTRKSAAPVVRKKLKNVPATQ